MARKVLAYFPVAVINHEAWPLPGGMYKKQEFPRSNEVLQLQCPVRHNSTNHNQIANQKNPIETAMPPRLLAKPAHLTRRLLAEKHLPRYRFPTPGLYRLARIHTNSKAAETPKAADGTNPTTTPLDSQEAERSVRYPADNNNSISN